MGLREYQRKRDFRRTAEPRGKSRSTKSSDARFVVQEHAATRLHYDFRLEHDGVLKSWAVPKGPSLDPSVKRLAMQVEDHPLEYGGFEGTIPKGQYGGGTVLLWDRGRWIPEGDPAEGLRKGSLKFRLEGEKLHGSWALIRMRGRAKGDGDRSWLLIKERDQHARPSDSFDVTRKRTRSVGSGRTLEEIAAEQAEAAPKAASRSRSKASTRSARAAPAAGSSKTKSRSRSTKVAPKAAAPRSTRIAPNLAAPRSTKVASKLAASRSTKVASKLAASRSTKVASKLAASRSPRVVSKLIATRPAKVASKGSPKVASKVVATRPAMIDGAQRGPMPSRIEPERATLVKIAPRGPDWVHEIKYDGYRALCYIEKGRVRWFTRGGLDWTARFAALSPALASLRVERAIIDGEIAVLRPDGTTSFQDLQQALSKKAGGRLAYYAFDLLYLDGYDLREATLEQRKAALAQLMQAVKLPPHVMYSDHITGGGAKLHLQACGHKLEGIVSKRRDARYRSGRQRDWLKVKCALRQEFVVGGYTLPAGARSGLGALLVGVYGAGGELRYGGRVGTGFDHAMLRDLRRRLEKIEIASPSFSNPPRGAGARGVRWVRPELVIEAEFTGWTEDGLLRHPSFEGIREDKPAREVVLERAESLEKTGKVASLRVKQPSARSSAKASTTRAKSSHRTAAAPDATVAGVRLSHPDRVLYPEHGITKLALAQYFERVAERMLPHVVGRPLSIVRCPQGQGSKCFYQKHYDAKFPNEVKSVDVGASSGREEYVMVDTLEGLVGLAQIGALELHPWGSRGDDVERPDRMFFDLDPSPEVPWTRVVGAAQRLRKLLGELGLESFVKTTGGKGLHVVVPLLRKHGWDDVKGFSKALAERVVREAPDEYIATASKARRTGRIFIDYLRNGRGATAVAPYSPRALAGAPVSAPVRWEDLGAKMRSDHFTVSNIAGHLRRTDPWRAFFTVRQALTAAMRKSLDAARAAPSRARIR